MCLRVYNGTDFFEQRMQWAGHKVLVGEVGATKHRGNTVSLKEKIFHRGLLRGFLIEPQFTFS